MCYAICRMAPSAVRRLPVSWSSEKVRQYRKQLLLGALWLPCGRAPGHGVDCLLMEAGAITLQVIDNGIGFESAGAKRSDSQSPGWSVNQ